MVKPYYEEAARWFFRSSEPDFDTREEEELRSWLQADRAHLIAYRRIEAVWEAAGAWRPRKAKA